MYVESFADTLRKDTASANVAGKIACAPALKYLSEGFSTKLPLAVKMANMQSLAQLESLCERLYNSSNPQERAHAEQTLQVFSVNTDYISQCQYILDNSASPYAQLLASSSLVKLLTDNTLSTQLRLDIRKGSAFPGCCVDGLPCSKRNPLASSGWAQSNPVAKGL